MKEAFIIGKDVSKGARSPILWNACFEHFKIDARMNPVDISNDQELNIFLNQQVDNPNFLGAAVASPIKESVSEYFIENFSLDFYGPANCFYREDNNFNILNTDTLAALETINLSFPDLNFKDIAILGSGAVAKSMAFSLREHKARKTIYARSNDSFATVQEFNFSCKDFVEINSNLGNHQIIVNCTDVGRDGNSDQSPIESSNFSEQLAENLFIFDINYIDSPSALLRACKSNGIPCVDGSRMNLMQAAIAFGKANNLSSIQNEILSVMENAIS
jgi:shikimate dehydrogenase